MNFKKIRLVLAPLAGISDFPYRLLCKKYGADLVFTEMISSESIVRSRTALKELLQTKKKEKPLAVQLFGSNPKILAQAASIVEKKADIIDINMGCPATKVTKLGAGAVLLSQPLKIKKILQEVASTTKKPISVKIRSDNAVKNSKIIEKAGASFITIHARKFRQGYSCKADWQIIKKVKESVSIPVIGNGDITSPEKAKEMLDITDAAMLGRAAIGNPYIFRQCRDYLKKGKYKELTDKEKLNLFWKYEKLAKHKNFTHIRQMALYFTHGIRGAAALRRGISVAKDIKQIKGILSKEL